MTLTNTSTILHQSDEPIRHYWCNPDGMSKGTIKHLINLSESNIDISGIKLPIEKRARTIIKVISDAGRFLSVKEIGDAEPSIGISRDSLRVYCDKMVSKGLLSRSGITVKYAKTAFIYGVTEI